MKYERKNLIAALASSALVVGMGGIALAQASGISAALADGTVGEKADGYMDFRGTPSSALRAEVDAINIKRRAAYTQLAAQRGVTVRDVAAAIGCETLTSRVAQGRAYQLPDGVWRVKGATPIALPSYCAGA